MIAVLSGIILVLIVALVIMSLGDDDEAQRQASSNTATAAPSAAPGPPSPAPSSVPWEEGQCLDVGVTLTVSSFDGGTALGCAAAGARAKILALVDDQLKCPKNTDGFARSGRHTACLRNLVGPHPGDPGKGGGVLRTGDCVYIAATSGSAAAEPQERECYDRYGPGKIWGFYKKKSQCKRPDGFLDNHYASRIADRRTPFLCTTAGYDVQTAGPQYEKGACFRKPAGVDTKLGKLIFGGLHEVSCGSSKAWGKVVASVSEQHCPRGTAYEVSSTDFYPGTTCLRKR